MKNRSFIYVILSVFLLLFFSCEKEEDPEDKDPEMVMIATAKTDENTFEVTIYARDTLFEGYNKLYVLVKNRTSMEKVTDATIAFKPLMDMIDIVHAAPVENPEGPANDEGLFEGAVVFIMPSSGMMGWTLDIDIKTGDRDETAVLEIPVVRNLEEKRKIEVISPLDDTKYFVSLVEPMKPVAGINECEFTIHYKENMMSFPPAVDLTVEIEPEMPSMDHGSPNNEHPVHTADGHYAGKINFTMTGWWRVHLTIKKGDDVITDDAYMDITLD